ncbi:MAG: 1-phosphofructokinase family hexose kinase [Chloroflexales bacterium]|nr:1-phosphofructokinase family hexose kinase [Chloroflexales bacterium]
MIITLTCNPACDRTLIVPGFRHSDVTRVISRHDAAGGKGLNVARALATLGGTCQAIVPLGGATGAHVASLASAEGLTLTTVPIHDQTRTCLLVTDPEAPDQLVINEPGPQVSAAEWQTLRQAVITAANTADYLTISGSLPPGIDATNLRHLINDIPSTCAVLLDTSGAPLTACLDARIALLKINASELSQAIGRPVTSHAEVVTAARMVCANGPRAVVITLGAAGAIAVDASGAWYVAAPTIHAVSPVGSGDCTLAGIAMAFQHGLSLAQALHCGVAAGSANALIPHAGVFDINQYTLFCQQLTVTLLD